MVPVVFRSVLLATGVEIAEPGVFSFDAKPGLRIPDKVGELSDLLSGLLSVTLSLTSAAQSSWIASLAVLDGAGLLWDLLTALLTVLEIWEAAESGVVLSEACSLLVPSCRNVTGARDERDVAVAERGRPISERMVPRAVLAPELREPPEEGRALVGPAELGVSLSLVGRRSFGTLRLTCVDPLLGLLPAIRDNGRCTGTAGFRGGGAGELCAFWVRLRRRVATGSRLAPRVDLRWLVIVSFSFLRVSIWSCRACFSCAEVSSSCNFAAFSWATCSRRLAFFSCSCSVESSTVGERGSVSRTLARDRRAPGRSGCGSGAVPDHLLHLLQVLPQRDHIVLRVREF